MLNSLTSFRFSLFNFGEKISRYINIAKRPDAKFLIQNEKRLKARVEKIFSQQQDYILAHLKELNLKANLISDDIDGILGALPGKEALTETVVAFMKTSIEKGTKTRIKEMRLGDFGIGFDVKNKKALKILEDKKTLELSNYKGNIHGVTKERISKILFDAANSGQSYQRTAQLIQAQGEAGVFSQARGELIAVREIGNAYEQGNFIPMEEFSEKYPDRETQKSWSTTNDDRVTPECKENQDQGWISLDAEFPSSDMTAPRDSNPRCRCATQYQIL